MKKLLAMLTTITSLSSITPIILANAPAKIKEKLNNNINLQENNLENLSRVKRGNNNFIENHYCFLCHNRLYVKISHRNWEKIRAEYNKRTRTSLYNFVYALLKNEFKKINSSGDDRSRDDFINEDIEIIANVVSDHFSDINQVFLNKNNNYEGLIIRTNRNKYWTNNDDFWGAHINKEDNGGEDLNDAIVNTQLGVLNNNDDKTILYALKEKNPDLLIDKLIVFKKTNSSATIEVKGFRGVKEYQSWSWKKVYFTITQDITVTQNLLTNKSYYMNIKNNEFKANPLKNFKIRNTTLAIAKNSGGDSYFATFDGVYFTKNNESTLNSTKIRGIDELIARIEIGKDDRVYFLGVSGHVYFFKTTWWKAERIDTYYNVPEIKNVLVVKTLPDSEGVYFSTDHGVYYMSSTSWTATKIRGIDELIARIEIDKDDRVYFLGVSGHVYFLRTTWWTAERIDTYYNVPEIKNVLVVKILPNSDAVYFSTNHGVYYMSSTSWTATKIGGIDEPIAEITFANSGSMYFTAVSGNAYYLPFYTLSENLAFKMDTHYNLPEIKNVISITTDSENDVYFSTDHGVFAMALNNWKVVKKIVGIDEPIAKMTIDKNDNVYLESLFSSSYTNKYKEKFNDIVNIQPNEPPKIKVDIEDEKIIKGVELLHNLQLSGDYGLIPVNRINRGYLEFVNSFSSVINYLNRNNIVTNATPENLNRLTRGIPYRLNNQNRFFLLNVDIISSNSVDRRLQLVFDSNNLYLQGFIIRNGETYTSHGTYYHFNDAVYTNLGDRNLESRTLQTLVRGTTPNSRPGSLPLNSSYIRRDGNNWGLGASGLNPNINWNNIRNAFRGLLNYEPATNESSDEKFRTNLILVILATSESWRFNDLYTRIARVSTNEGTSQEPTSFSWDTREFGGQFTEWDKKGNFQGPLDDTAIFDRNNNYIDLRFISALGFLSSIRIANSK